MDPRLTRDKMFMQIAEIVAQRSTCPRKHVGAVMVRENHIVSIGYNGAPPGLPHCTDGGCALEFPHEQFGLQGGCTRAIHAEMNCIAFAARQGAPTDDATMYCTCATCANCAALLASSGIKRFVYLESYRLTAGIDLLKEANVEVIQWSDQVSSPAPS